MTRSDQRNTIDFQTLLEVNRHFENSGFRFLIFGGWGLDILSGGITRPHEDIDLFFCREDYSRLLKFINNAGWTAFELPGIQVAIKAPFTADITFLDDPEADTVIGIASKFRVEVPRRGFDEWTFGSVDGHSLPIGCRELVIKLTRRKRGVDAELADRLTEDSDPTLLADILIEEIDYDYSSIWLPVK